MKIKYLILSLFICACDDDSENPATITCYSGSQIFYQGKSADAVYGSNHNNRWYFHEQNTNTQVGITGSCVVKYDHSVEKK